jgi:hypothetical protein
MFSTLATVICLITMNSCNIFRKSINKSLFAGHWLTTEPEKNPNIILDSTEHFLLLLEDSESADTMHYKYKLKGDIMTIWLNERLWASKNKITKLTNDSLVYRQRGDKEVFRYGRKINH